jgi:hypothetical protein
LCQRLLEILLALNPGTGLRQDAEIDAVTIHFTQSKLIEIAQLRAQPGEHFRFHMLDEAFGVPLEAWGHEMLFESYLSGFSACHRKALSEGSELTVASLRLSAAIRSVY